MSLLRKWLLQNSDHWGRDCRTRGGDVPKGTKSTVNRLTATTPIITSFARGDLYRVLKMDFLKNISMNFKIFILKHSFNGLYACIPLL